MTKTSFRPRLSFLRVAIASTLGGGMLLAQPTLAAKPSTKMTPSAQAKSTHPSYQQARTELKRTLGPIGEDYYAVYRIVERVARANGLDEQPWRIRVSDSDVLGAYASDLNMLTFEGGLLEQMQGDTAALACVVGHEMAHHTKGHGAVRTEVRAQLNALQVEALEEARAEVEGARQQANIFGAIIGVVTSTIGVNVPYYSNKRIAAGVANRIFQGLNTEQANDAAARAEEIYAARVEALDGEYSAVSRANESEADEIGYRYIVRAGFDPTGCARAMDVLTRTVTSRLPGISHPQAADRVAALSALNTAANNQPLIAQGNANLSRSPKPLEYGFGRDGGSLRVESRFGARDIDEGFPQ